MLTKEEVIQILQRLHTELDTPLEMPEEIAALVYRSDSLSYGGTVTYSRHIDVEYDYSGCYGIHEDTPLFQFIGALCGLPQKAEEDVRLY
jgi:hypothetical protein